jgi:methanogenic corrinoid protein MtbC1
MADNDSYPELKQEFLKALLSLDRIQAERIFTRVINLKNSSGSSESLIVDVLETIGTEWENGKYALSQVYMSGRICEELAAHLPVQAYTSRENMPAMAIALLNDYHALGKRMVLSVLHSTGYAVTDYGRMDVPNLVAAIKQDGIQIILISVLMLPSALHVKDLRQALNAAGLPVKIVVGGAPFRLNKELWKTVGADAAGHTAANAIEIIHSICRGGTP